ncbi:hypothetical protein [Cupriavidus sp. WS]|uniref:hypothetical protein n=1 Tax=Cupriavidus sp. WS TaxID=1312922 RepID=UPI000362A754|nr:hypothetical protein [Cupriavidus sp. WS]
MSQPNIREVSLGIRPRAEREFVPHGDPAYPEVAPIEAFTFKRYLDRFFWHPRPEDVRFEVRAIPSPAGSIYDVVAVVGAGIGEAWFSEAAIPERWDFVALTENSFGLSKMQRRKLKEQGKLEDDDRACVDGPLPDSSSLENPEEVEQRRWAVLARVRAASRAGRLAATEN